MHHPEAVAHLLRERSTWREPFENRGSRDHAAEDWTDSAAALAGCTGLAYAAFMFRHSEDPPAPALVAHLIETARRPLAGNDTVTAEQLVALLLREERAPVSQRQERHRYMALGVTRGVWRYRVARPYTAIATELESLVSDAWRVARARLDNVA